MERMDLVEQLPPMKHSRIYEITKEIVDRLMALQMSVTLTMGFVEASYKMSAKRIDEFAKGHAKQDDGKSFVIEYEQIQFFKKLEREHRVLSQSLDILPRAYFVSILSQFDAFVGHLLRYYFTIFPGALDSSEKTFRYSEIASFSSINDVFSALISEEIETVLRKNYSDIFKYLEKKFDAPLTKDLPIWVDFIEMAQRRNLFVHCDGIISQQYIAACSAGGCELGENIVVGKQLHVPPDYYIKSTNVIFEIVVKLSQVVWRKVFKNEGGGADRSLIDITFEALCCEDYDAVKSLSVFCTKYLHKRFESEENELVMLVNCAIAFKLSGNKMESDKLLQSYDWSSRSDKFRIAVAVLSDKFDEAISYMHILGSKGVYRKEDYCTWPLFKELREREEFKIAYEQIFGESFNVVCSRNVQCKSGHAVKETVSKVNLQGVGKPKKAKKKRNKK